MRDIFNSYNVTELRRLAVERNKKVKIAGVAKMKKEDLVEALKKHKEHFKDLKMKPKISERKQRQIDEDRRQMAGDMSGPKTKRKVPLTKRQKEALDKRLKKVMQKLDTMKN